MESPHEGVASGFTYEDITMDGVQHPINIDQHYCPFPPVTPVLLHIFKLKILHTITLGVTSKLRTAVSFKPQQSPSMRKYCAEGYQSGL
ncbi:hypothetical protein NC652_029035 [Populus alba x Populus x berolinensis]|nr:hypothetical protein NC652_029035 [Populus alba x Populus x berolinensis]